MPLGVIPAGNGRVTISSSSPVPSEEMAPPNEGAGNENGILAAENQPGHGIVAASTDEPVAPLDTVHPGLDQPARRAAVPELPIVLRLSDAT
jgi:hypothetical protein